MRQKKGLSLLEVLIAMTILAIVIGYTGLGHLTIRNFLLQQRGYRYVALNLAREVLEFGEAGRYVHSFRLKYYYSIPTVCTIPDTGCGAGCGSGLDPSGEGYKLREWYYFCPDSWPHPFTYLGDIKAKGLVPESHPDSVVIYYKVEQDGIFYNAYKQTVEVTWTEDDGSQKEEVISGIPLTQVNNQLKVTVGDFTWQ